MISMLLSTLLFAPTVQAAPVHIPIHGELSSIEGIRLEGGDVPIVFTLYRDFARQDVAWSSGTQTVAIEWGEFNAMLGGVAGIPSSVFESNPPMYIGIRVDDDSEMPLIRLSTTPHAYRAQYFGSLPASSIYSTANPPKFSDLQNAPANVGVTYGTDDVGETCVGQAQTLQWNGKNLLICTAAESWASIRPTG